ncbi:S8 family serine peptidase [Bowmanella dokdonensis]|uniref:S8 family serine peptidase n=1 Tax=Bowmanella dokdonensis TaxID=751969 RepID=A0A939DQQ9_9ALTE|nr:S8 family serine peptidase [Bowmanella dokdonensis]MBN7827223.1 S8 family serine peptidase [Bowmanella dokdonensis]
MKLKSSSTLIGALSLVALAVGSASATELKPQSGQNNATGELSFADWLAQQRAKREDVTDRMILTFEDAAMVQAFKADKGVAAGASVSAAKRNQADALMSSMRRLSGDKVSFVKELGNGKAVFALSQARSVKQMKALAQQLSQNANVVSAEPDPRRYPLAENQPWGISAVQADQLSDASASNMTVCVIDSGYDINHPDLSGNQHDGTNDSGTGNWYVPGGSHGTHVAGTIAAINNSEGVVGVLPNQNVNLHIVKVFNEQGWAYSSDLVDAVNTCASNGAKVVNMSLGGASSSTSESNGMQNAYDNGVLLIAAAGNDGNSTHSYPASYNAVVSVAAVDESGKHAEFSQYTNQVELSGPGEAILSSVGLGDGRQGYLSWGSNSAGDDRVLPHSRYVSSGGSYVITNINASVSGQLAACSTSGTSFSCGNMSGKVCVIERAENQSGSNYPEINPVLACANAGAAGVVVYGDTERPGLQNPYLVDGNSEVTVPTVSVSRTLGQQLVAASGTGATLQTVGNTDYAYYNGTSMASPHVAGVAALAWSNNPTCTASEVRSALTGTAQDLDVSGRDNRTGYGMAQAKAASDYLSNNCGGSGGGGSGSSELENGVAKTNLSASQGQSLDFTLTVPSGATDLSFAMSGGSGDADLYVSFGASPSTSSYDCRSWNSGNQESCSFSAPQAGTYYVKVQAYSAFSGASLTASFTEPSSGGGGGAEGGSASASDISASRNQWARYTLEVPAGMAYLEVTTTGGSGDADLYLRFNADPTTSTYACRSWESGNSEVCRIDNPSAGTWHLGLHAYRAFSGVSLNAQWQP